MAYLSLGHQRVSVLGALPAFGVGILHNCRDFSTVHSGSAIRARRLESKFSGVEVIMVFAVRSFIEPADALRLEHVNLT